MISHFNECTAPPYKIAGGGGINENELNFARGDAFRDPTVIAVGSIMTVRAAETIKTSIMSLN